MTHIESFDSMEDAFAAMEAHEVAANSTLSPGQIALRDDVENTRYWAQAVPDADLIIYGIAQPSFLVKRSADFDVDSNRARGYVTGTAYSAAVPDGEYGDTHVSQIVPVTPDVFRLAQEKGWPDWSALFLQEHRDLGRALAAAERISLGRQD